MVGWGVVVDSSTNGPFLVELADIIHFHCLVRTWPAPTYRWVFLADPDSFELLPDDRVVRFTNAAGLVLKDPSAISYVQCKTIGFYVIPDLKSLDKASEAERNDRQVVLRAVEAAGFELRYASERLRGNYELAEAAVEQDGLVMLIDNCIPEQFRQDPRIRLAAVKSNRLTACLMSATDLLPANEADNPDIIRAVLTAPVKTNDALIALLHPALQGFVPRLQKLPTLFPASDRLKADPDFVIEAMQHSYNNLLVAAQALKNDPNFILRCIDAGATLKGNLKFFGLLGPTVQADRALVLYYIRRHGNHLPNLPENLQSDPEVLLAALESHPDWLPFLSEEVRADRRFVKTALRPYQKWLGGGTTDPLKIETSLTGGHSHLLACVSPNLKQDSSFVRELLDQGCSILDPMLEAGGYALEPELILQFVRDVIKARAVAKAKRAESHQGSGASDAAGASDAVAKGSGASDAAAKANAKTAEERDAMANFDDFGSDYDFQRFLERLLEDGRFNKNRDLLLVVLPILGPAHRSCQDLLSGSKDRELVLAVFQYPRYPTRHDLFQHLSEELRDDLEVAKCVVTFNPEMFRFASERLRGDTDLAEIAITFRPALYMLTQGAARHNRGVVFAALQPGGTIKPAGWYTRRNNDYRPLCLAPEPRLSHLPAEYRDDREVVLLVVKQNGLNLQHASDRLRGDWGVVEAASAERKYSRGKALVFASESLKKDSKRIAELYAKIIVERAVARAKKVRERIERRVSMTLLNTRRSTGVSLPEEDPLVVSDSFDSDAEPPVPALSSWRIFGNRDESRRVDPCSDDARFGRDSKSSKRVRDLNTKRLEDKMRELYAEDEYQKNMRELARVFSTVKPSPPENSAAPVGPSETSGAGSTGTRRGAASSSSAAAAISSDAAGARKRNAEEWDDAE